MGEEKSKNNFSNVLKVRSIAAIAAIHELVIIPNFSVISVINCD